MKKIVLFLILLAAFELNAQVASNKFLVRFTDKNNSPYSITTPSGYLSTRAISRRTIQGIAITTNDLPVNSAYIDSVKSTGVTILSKSKWFNTVTIQTTDNNALNIINSFPFVSHIDSIARISKPIAKVVKTDNKPVTNTVVTHQEMSIPIELKTNQKISNIDYGMGYNQISMIGGDYLHNLGYKGENIIIAIIDAGFWYADTLSVFDSLWTNNQILAAVDFVEPGGNVFRKSTHGMMVLSIIGGNKPGYLVGTAPKANFLLLRSEDTNSEYIIEEYNWATAAEYADSAGADVINSSLGYTTFDNISQNHSYADMNGNTCPATIAADIAASKGIIVCNSAGNSGNDPWHYIGAPADADSIITVGAVDNMGAYALFSSTGRTSDGRIKPTVSTQGQATWVASTSGGIQSGNGTSFSSPVLAGAVACLLQANPTSSNMQIIEAIKESANQYTNPDSLLGYGIPNFAAANLILSNITIHNFESDNLLNVFPNPFTDLVNIVFSSSGNQKIIIELFDITGKRIYRHEESTHVGYNNFVIGKSIDFSKGVYILKVSDEQNVFTHKIISAGK